MIELAAGCSRARRFFLGGAVVNRRAAIKMSGFATPDFGMLCGCEPVEESVVMERSCIKRMMRQPRTRSHAGLQFIKKALI